MQIKKVKLFFREIWVSDPGTRPIGFVSKFRAFWWYLCVRNTDLEPDRAKIDFGTPLPKKVLKYARILLGYLAMVSFCIPMQKPIAGKSAALCLHNGNGVSGDQCKSTFC